MRRWEAVRSPIVFIATKSCSLLFFHHFPAISHDDGVMVTVALAHPSSLKVISMRCDGGPWKGGYGVDVGSLFVVELHDVPPVTLPPPSTGVCFAASSRHVEGSH